MEGNAEKTQHPISDDGSDSSDYGEYLNQYNDDICIDEPKYSIEYIEDENEYTTHETTETSNEDACISSTDTKGNYAANNFKFRQGLTKKERTNLNFGIEYIKGETTDTVNEKFVINTKEEEEEANEDVFFSNSDIEETYEEHNFKFQQGITQYKRVETLKNNVIILGSKPNEKISYFFDTKSLKYSTDSDTDDDDASIAALSRKKKNNIAENEIFSQTLLTNFGDTEDDTIKNNTMHKNHDQKTKITKSKKDSKICEHCKKEFEDKDQLIYHLTQVAKEKSLIEIKQELLNDLRKDFGILLDNTKICNEKTKDTNIDVDNPASTVSFVDKTDKMSNIIKQLKRPKKSAKKRTVELLLTISNKRKTEKKKQTDKSPDKSKTHSKKRTTPKKTKTDKHIKMKIKKNKLTKEYAVEHTGQTKDKNLDISGENLSSFNDNEYAEHSQNNDRVETVCYTHKPKTPVPKNEIDIPSTFGKDDDMPMLSEINPIYYYNREHLKLCKVKPFQVQTPFISAKDTTPNYTVPTNSLINVHENIKQHYDTNRQALPMRNIKQIDQINDTTAAVSRTNYQEQLNRAEHEKCVNMYLDSLKYRNLTNKVLTQPSLAMYENSLKLGNEIDVKSIFKCNKCNINFYEPVLKNKLRSIRMRKHIVKHNYLCVNCMPLYHNRSANVQNFHQYEIQEKQNKTCEISNVK